MTTGGSSGGESALISFRGSLIGVGTDIGGENVSLNSTGNPLNIKQAVFDIHVALPVFMGFVLLMEESAISGLRTPSLAKKLFGLVLDPCVTHQKTYVSL